MSAKKTKYEVIEVEFSVKAVVEIPVDTDVEEVIAEAAKTANAMVKDDLFKFDKEDVTDISKIN